MSARLSEITDEAMSLNRDDQLALITFLWDRLVETGELPHDEEAMLAQKRAEDPAF